VLGIEKSPERLSDEPTLNRVEIADHLAELGIDVQLGDWEEMDDNDVLGNIATLAMMYDMDIDETMEAIGVPVEKRNNLE
jgi:hypothetical protein